MVKPGVLLYQGLVTNILLFFAWATPTLAQSLGRPEIRVGIEDITSVRTRDVQWHRDGRWDIAREEKPLDPGNWLATGEGITQATMWYEYPIRVLYRQVADTFSRFMPMERCGFYVQSGRTLYADPGSGIPPEGCRTITLRTGEAVVNPPSQPDFSLASQDIQNLEIGNSAVVLFVFRNRDAQETTVGVLASQRGPVQVINTISNREDLLNAGEFAVLSSEGDLVKGRFSLRDFYKNNPLTLGLGSAPEDEAYVAQIVDEEEKRLISAVREATLEAVREQPEPGPFTVRRLGESSQSELRTLPDLPSFLSPLECTDYPGSD